MDLLIYLRTFFVAHFTTVQKNMLKAALNGKSNEIKSDISPGITTIKIF